MREELVDKVNKFFEKYSVGVGIRSSRNRVLGFCKNNDVDANASKIRTREFPKSAYADELEKYPTLRD